MEICKKYVWDLGEYNIQNPDNHSYEIIDPYLEGCKRYNVYGQFKYKNASIFEQCREPSIWDIDSRRLLVSAGYNPTVELIAQLRPNNPNYCNPNYRIEYQISQYDSQCQNQVTEVFIVASGTHYELINIEYFDAATGNSPPIKLKIIDGGIESIYSIINRGSVQLVEYECGCPPNQLDCGDCCLDCNNTFNEISGIRALVRSLS